MKQKRLKREKVVITNVGWTLGNECPFRCKQCYSMLARTRGRNLTVSDIDRIVSQLYLNRVKIVNLGGNEPLFTNGINPKDTLLPYVIASLNEKGMIVGLTSAGVTVTYLSEKHRREFSFLSDIDVSLDSPFKFEHDTNRGACLYDKALSALQICQDEGKEHTIVMCGMNWNLTETHLKCLVVLAKETESNIRINFLKPIEPEHFKLLPTPRQYYESVACLLDLCTPISMDEPTLHGLISEGGGGCPCGRHSCRINSITPDGKVPISPCVYLHDFRTGDLLQEDFRSIVNSSLFNQFRERSANARSILGCEECEVVDKCGGGCAARAYCMADGTLMDRLFSRDPYCPTNAGKMPSLERIGQVTGASFPERKSLVHHNYLCTLILKPR